MNDNIDHFEDVFNDSFLLEMDHEEIDFDVDFAFDSTPFLEELTFASHENSIKCEINHPPQDSSKIMKKRKFNADTSVIAAITAETLKKLDLDPNSKDGKQKKRQIRNRMSAQYHRDRKNAYIAQLEQTITEKLKEVERLTSENFNLIRENCILRSLSGGCLSSPQHCDSSTDSDADSVDSNLFAGFEKTDCVLPSISQLVDQINTNGSGNRVPLQFKEHASTGVPNPSFGLSPLSRSLTIISMMCVICILFSGGNMFNSFDSNHTVSFHAPRSSFVLEAFHNPSDNRRQLAMFIQHSAEQEEIQSEKMLGENEYGINYPSTKNDTRNSAVIKKEDINLLSSTAGIKNRYLRVTTSTDRDVQDSKEIVSTMLSMSDLSTPRDNVMSHVYHSADQTIPFGHSSSNMVVTDGCASLDPAIFKVTRQETVSSSTTNAPPRIIPQPSTTSRDVSHVSRSDLKHWMAPYSSKPLLISNVDSEHNSGVDELFMRKLLSESNLVTIQLPLSLIRMGGIESMDSNRDGHRNSDTADAIVSALNLRSHYHFSKSAVEDDGLNGNDSYTFPVNSTDKIRSTSAAVMIEINCLILGAKLVLTKSD